MQAVLRTDLMGIINLAILPVFGKSLFIGGIQILKGQTGIRCNAPSNGKAGSQFGLILDFPS